MNFDTGSAMFLGMTTAVLSLGQAWAFEAQEPAGFRYILVWAGAVLMMVGTAYQAFDLPHAGATYKHEAILILLAASSLIATIALLAGARWGKRGIGDASFIGAAAALAPIHLAVVLVGGVVEFAIYFVWGMGRGPW